MMERVETGPVQFGDDWPGVFIRGDNAAWYAVNLRLALEQSGFAFSERLTLEQLVELLESCNVANAPTPRLLEQPAPQPEPKLRHLAGLDDEDLRAVANASFDATHDDYDEHHRDEYVDGFVAGATTRPAGAAAVPQDGTLRAAAMRVVLSAAGAYAEEGGVDEVAEAEIRGAIALLASVPEPREPDGWLIERDGGRRLFGRMDGMWEYCDVHGVRDVLDRLRYLPGAQMFELYRRPYIGAAPTESEVQP
jgi:hypothetical protein